MFLSKFLSGRNVAKSKLELLTEAWTNIQKYYETAAGKVCAFQLFFFKRTISTYRLLL